MMPIISDGARMKRGIRRKGKDNIITRADSSSSILSLTLTGRLITKNTCFHYEKTNNVCFNTQCEIPAELKARTKDKSELG